MKGYKTKKATSGHMRKRATCFLLVLLLVIALLPTTAFAAPGYIVLKAAIDKAIVDSLADDGSDQPVQLTGDVTTDGIEIDASDAKITIDGSKTGGGKYNLSYESSESHPENEGRTIYIIGGDVTLINIIVNGWIEVSDGATLTVGTGAGIQSDYNGVEASGAGTKIIVGNGGTVHVNETDYSKAGIYVTDGAEVIVKNGGMVDGADLYGIYGETSAKVTVEGGTVYGYAYGININGAGVTADISGGDINGDIPISVNGGADLVIGEGAVITPSTYYHHTIDVDGSKLTVSGGTVKASGQVSCAIYAGNTSQVFIEDGLVSQTHADGADAAGIYVNNNSKLTVSGGIITAAGISGYGIKSGDGAEVEINGGTVSGNTGIEVSGCDKDHTSPFSVPATLSVTGGLIEGNIAVKATSYTSTPNSGSTVTAAGGTINGTRSAIAFEDGCTISVSEAATVQTGVHLEATCGAISPAAGDNGDITLTIKDSVGNIVDADYSELIMVSGYSAAPDGTSGRFNTVELAGAATSVGVEFTDGVAVNVPLILNNAERQDISFHILGEGSPYNASIAITPVPAEAAFLAVTTMPRGPAVNGGVLTAQPVVKIADNYGNTVTSDSSTTVTASKRDGEDWTLGGNVTAVAVSGVATFEGLTATKNTDDTIMTAALDFSAGSLAGTYSSDFTVPVCYTVTFDSNGGNTEANPTTKAAVSGESVGTLPTAPSRTGYTFIGWNTADDGAGTPFRATTEVTSDITVYAKWISSTPTEKFNLPVGSTCYFDLSPVTCSAVSAEINTDLPDANLKWVPFTYAGTINAYSLDESLSGLTTASSIAAEYAGPRSLFLADDVLYTGTSWNELNAADLIFGKNYTANGVSYLLRSLSGGGKALYNSEGDWIANTPESNEWDQILNKESYIHNYDDHACWCQDTYDRYGFNNYRIFRGPDTAEKLNFDNSSATNAALDFHPALGFRPALEILNTDTLSSNALKTVIYEMGDNGTLGSGSLTSAAAVYAGELTLPEITEANGFYYTGTPEADKLLGWFDGSVFYPAGTRLYELPSGTVLTAGEISTYTVTFDSNGGDSEANPTTKTAISGGNVGMLPTAPSRAGYIFAGWNTAANGNEDIFTAATAVNADITVYAHWTTEQFNLPVGSTCYFDLSSVTVSSISVVKNSSLPDADLKWVPFTYAGTVNAYSLDESANGVTTASITAAENADNRSLFVADYDLYLGVSWVELNAADLIFGNTENNYTVNGVSYLLRALSGGSNGGDEIAVTPESNEWDQILNKGSYIHNNYDWAISSWCQDTSAGYDGYRAHRGNYWANVWACTYSTAGHCFRPALEILNADTLSADALKTVIYEMGDNGTLGSGSLTSAAAVYTGELTLPEISEANGFDYTGAPEAGKVLGWFNGSVFYEACKKLSSLSSGTVLTAGYGIPTHALTIAAGTGGTISTGSSGDYTAGAEINIAATPSANYIFSRWESTDGGTFGSTTSAATAFMMPAGATTVTAIFTYSGGSGGNGGNSPLTSTGTETNGNTVTATAKITSIVNSNGKAAASVTKDQLSSAVNSAVAEAKKQGAGTAAVVEIKVDAPANSNSVETSIPKDAVGLAANGGTDALKISTPVASISFDPDTLDSIYGEAAGDVKISATKVDASTLADETKELVGDRPVFNFSVTSGDNTISEFNGNVTVSVPYTLKEGEDPEAIVVYYINAEGNLETVSNCHYDPATGQVAFATDHFSKYVVGYNKVSFADVKTGAWYENAVDFAAARGIVTGTGNGNFSPDGKLTRGQLLVMLMRAYGIAPDTNLSNNFSDAGNTYYTGYLAAAKRLGITEGLGNNLYAPEKQITRQEMFTLLFNTLDVIGQLPEGEKAGGALTESDALTGYSDVDSVASWAKDAAGALADAGIVGGSNGKLSPANTTTRAEMAQVLYNLLGK